MAAEPTVNLRLKAFDDASPAVRKLANNLNRLSNKISPLKTKFQAFDKSLTSVKQNLGKLGAGMKNVGASMTKFITLPVVAAGALSVRAFSQFEDALVGVGKTTGLAGAPLAKLGERFKVLSTEIPFSAKSLLALGQTAAQVGVKGAANIEKFAVTMAKLSKASDIVGEEGATQLARLIKVTNANTSEVDQFASALVGLGNKSAATEAEILSFATRLGSNLAVFRATGVQVLGLATAMKSVGIKAEAGSSAVQRAFGAINKAIVSGGDKMKALIRLTGISGDQLKKRFKEDSVGVFQKFVEGLKKAEDAEVDLTESLAFFGLTGVRDIAVIGTLTQKTGLLSAKLKLAREEFDKNTALEEEFLATTKTLSSALTLLVNKLTKVAITIGAKLAPAIKFVAKIFGAFFEFLENNPTIATLIGVFAGLVAVLGPVLFFVGLLLTALPALIAGFAVLGITTLPLTGTILAIAAGIAAVIAVITILILHFDTIKAFFSENPFGIFLKSLFLIFTPLGQLITLVRLVVAAFSGLDAVVGVIKSTLGIFTPDEDEDAKGAEAKSIGSRASKAQAVQSRQSVTVENQSRISVDFKNTPPGTQVRTEAEGQDLDLTLGFAGV